MALSLQRWTASSSPLQADPLALAVYAGAMLLAATTATTAGIGAKRAPGPAGLVRNPPASPATGADA